MSAPKVHGPADLPDLRLWLAEQWLPGRPFATSAAALHTRRSATVARADNYARAEHSWLRHAGLWWVASDMVDLLLAAANGVPDDLGLFDLPNLPGAGLVVFEKPWWGIDGEQPGRQVQVDALVWGGVTLPAIPDRGRAEACAAVAISTYRRMDFAMGMSPAELPLALETGGLQHARQHYLGPEVAEGRPQTAVTINDDGDVAEVEVLPDGGRPRSAQRRVAYSLTGETWLPLGRSDWPVPDPIGRPPWAMPDQTAASMVEDRKVLAAFWHLLHQEGIASRVVRKADRPAQRRTQRAGVAKELSGVQVVTLRRLERTEYGPDPDAEPRKHDHRWLVSGHWRWQPCGPQRSERRLTYVRPHVKGPEGTPLRTPTRVNAWVR